MADQIPSGAIEAVKGFLKFTLDTRDEAKAREFLAKASATDPGLFQMPDAQEAKKSYVIGTPALEGGQVFVPVTLTDEASGQAMTLPLAPVLEEGGWKLDMGKMMEKWMGGAVGQLVEQVGNAMGEVMEGIGEAMQTALGGGQSDAPKMGAEDAAKIEKKVAAIEEELSRRHDLPIRVEVDIPSFMGAGDERGNGRVAEAVTEDVLRNFVYAVTEAQREVPLADRVKVIRLEGVRTAGQRAVYAEGARIIYRLTVREANGFYDGQTLATLLTGVAAGMEETAPPGELESKPSYRPSGEGAKIVKDYQEFVVPRTRERMATMLDRGLGIAVEWEQFADKADDAAALWIWGLNRLCGAIGLLARKGEYRGALKDAIGMVRIVRVPEAGMKAIEWEENELRMYFSPEEGEAGGFYEGEIAERISRKLKLRTRPMIAELERYAKRWETSLTELFREKDSSDGGGAAPGVSIQYAFDWDGFTCNDDESKNVLALTRLRENGIDWMYYALASLVAKNPNFKQQLPMRVRWIYLEHAPSAARKGIHGEQTTVALKIFLHEGYDGYLTPKELERALPGIVAGMPDIVEEQRAEATPEEQEELAELEGLRVSEEALAALRGKVDARLGQFSQSLRPVLGTALPVEVEWESMDGEAEEVEELLNPVLEALTEALSAASQEAAMRSAIAAEVDKVVVRQSEEEEAGWALVSRELIFTISREEEEGERMEAKEVGRRMREALGAAGASMEAKPGEGPNERTPQPYVAAPDRAAEADAGALKAQFEGMLPAYAEQFAMILGKPVDFEIEWGSVKDGFVGMGQLLNAGLTPTVGGLALLASDPKKKLLAQRLIARVVLRQTAAAREHGFSLTGSTLTYSAALIPGVPPMEPQLAAALLGTVLQSKGLAKRVRPKARKKAVPKKKPPKRGK